MLRALAVVAAVVLGGCSLTLDPDGPKRPPETPAVCVPTGCAGKACGYDDCGTVCAVGSGCVNVHSVAAGRIGAAGAGAAAAGHSVQGGLSAGAATLSAPTGHAVDAGTISQ